MATELALPRPAPQFVSDEIWEEAGWLPCLVSVDLAIQRFTVRDLLQLEPGSVLETTSLNAEDVPVLVNSQLIGWAEFEVIGEKLAVRLTDLA